MKKHFRFLSALALVLVACTLLSACSGAKQSSPKGIFADDVQFDETPTMKTVQKGSIEGNYMRAYGDLAVVIDGKSPNTRYRVYNYVTDTVVLEWEDSESEKLVEDQIGLLVVDDETIFWLNKETKGDDSTSNTTVFYDDQGREICNFPKITSATAVADMMMAENRYYRMEDGTFTLKFEHSLLAAELPEFTAWNEDYYYSIQEDGFMIYDEYGRLAGSYVFPSNGTNAVSVILSNGDILLQYQEALPSDATTYDIFRKGSSTEKYNLVSLIYNTGKGTTKKVNLDYMITYNLARNVENVLVNGDDFSDMHKSIDNMAMIIPIEDKILMTDQMQTVSLNNSGNIQKVLNATIENQSLMPAIPVMEDRYLVSNLGGMSFLVDGKGEMIGEVTNADMENSNNVFVLTAGRVYDIDLKYVIDYSMEGYELYEVLDNLLLFTKTEKEDYRDVTSYYRMTKDMSAPEKLEFEVVECGEGYYALKENDKSYIYYNDCGEEIFRSETKLTYIGTSVDASTMLFREDKLFYRFMK